MTRNPFSHLDLRVRSAAEAIPFYDVLAPAVGFTTRYPGKVWNCWDVPGTYPSQPWIGITEFPDHRPNENRIAFWVESREEVDRIGALLRDAGARIESGPRECPDYSRTYYAVFFEDPSGNKLEVVHRTD